MQSEAASYGIALHQHRFAAWAAARAASVVGRRFRVEDCGGWLEACNFDASFTYDDLPDRMAVDETHRAWRVQLIKAAKRRSDFEMSHGQASKIINCYLKARFVISRSGEDQMIDNLHPPIDRLLLNGLLESGVVSRDHLKTVRWLRDVGWSKWDSSQYEDLIGILRGVVAGRPFWTIESYWRGFQ